MTRTFSEFWDINLNFLILVQHNECSKYVSVLSIKFQISSNELCVITLKIGESSKNFLGI